MKVYDYIIVLKRPNFLLIDGISQLMLLLAILVFATSIPLSYSGNLKPVFFSIVLMMGILGWWVFCYYKQRKGNTPYFRLALLMASIGWYYQPNGWYLSIIYLIAALLEKQVKFPQEIAFDEVGILVNSFPKKQNYWHEIANVVLKDSIITIDFKSNKLIQKEIETPVNLKTETEFNEFCSDKINTERLMLKA